MSETRTYEGSCHCGAVKFKVTGQLDKGMTCNCSICHRAGYVLTFLPAASFELVAGREALTDYQFGRKHIHHTFCSRCGVRPFSHGNAPDGREMYAVNLRCLDDVDLGALQIDSFDGKRLPAG